MRLPASTSSILSPPFPSLNPNSIWFHHYFAVLQEKDIPAPTAALWHHVRQEDLTGEAQNEQVEGRHEGRVGWTKQSDTAKEEEVR